jgi:hypothetical protein
LEIPEPEPNLPLGKKIGFINNELFSCKGPRDEVSIGGRVSLRNSHPRLIAFCRRHPKPIAVEIVDL